MGSDDAPQTNGRANDDELSINSCIGWSAFATWLASHLSDAKLCILCHSDAD
jgi:hypothetical protein